MHFGLPTGAGKTRGGGAGRTRALYSQSPNLRHVVEAGDQDAADVVVVEGAAETRKNRDGQQGAA